MRILFVSQEYPPETGWGGIGTYLGIHAPALARAGHDVHVLSSVAEQPCTDMTRDGVTVHRRGLIRSPRGPGRLAPQAWRRLHLARSVAAHRPPLGPFDVIEAPEWMAESLLLSGTPLVVHLHSSAAQLFGFVGRRGPDPRLAVALEDRSIRRADLVIGSRVALEEARAHRGLPPVVEVPYPVSVLAPRAQWADGPPRIVFVGRFEQRKGPDLLVEALPLVLDRHPEAVLELVGRDTALAGGGTMLERLRARARALSVEHALSVVEAWGRHSVEAALAGAAACVVPSRWESFGYAAAEAVAGGTPTIVSSWPTLRELVGDGAGGTVVPREDGASWAAAICSVLDDPAGARTRALSGRERLTAAVSPDRIAAIAGEAYGRAAASL